MTEQQLVAAFGLNRYPFARKELCPVHNDTDIRMYARVDGFGERAQSLETAAGSLTGGAQVLIYGPRASGRSSVANFLAHHLSRPAGSLAGRSFASSCCRPPEVCPCDRLLKSVSPTFLEGSGRSPDRTFPYRHIPVNRTEEDSIKHLNRSKFQYIQ